MAMVAGQRSTLNPNAPVFIPAVYREVEDFSPEWWELVKSCTWYRDYWLSQHPVESFNYDHEQDEFDQFDDEVEMVWLSEDEEEEEEEEKTKPAVIDNGGSVGVTKNSKMAMDATSNSNAVIKELNQSLSIPKKYVKEMSTVKSTVAVKAPKYQTKAFIKKSAAFAPRLIIHQPR